MFAFEKLSQAKMLGSAPFLHAVSVGAEFSPRAQAVAAAGAANCRFEKVNTAPPNRAFKNPAKRGFSHPLTIINLKKNFAILQPTGGVHNSALLPRKNYPLACSVLSRGAKLRKETCSTTQDHNCSLIDFGFISGPTLPLSSISK